MSRKREKPYFTRHQPYTYPKRRRPLTLPIDAPPPEKPSPPPALLIIGLPTNCSVLDLKSRFEIYGSISRTRIDHQGVGFITFRSKSSADAAFSASIDPSFAISIDSHPVAVRWAGESESRNGENKERNNLSSKLLKGGAPLSRYGKGNRLSSAIVNPNSSTSTSNGSSMLDRPPLKPREIVAYDDIL